MKGGEAGRPRKSGRAGVHSRRAGLAWFGKDGFLERWTQDPVRPRLCSTSLPPGSTARSDTLNTDPRPGRCGPRPSRRGPQRWLSRDSSRGRARARCGWCRRGTGGPRCAATRRLGSRYRCRGPAATRDRLRAQPRRPLAHQLGVYFTALSIRFAATCCNLVASAITTTSEEVLAARATPLASATSR